MKKRKRTYYLELVHPSGRVTTKKFKSSRKSVAGIKNDYYSTAHHFRTEAGVAKVRDRR